MPATLRRPRGFSLVELLVALVVTAVVIGGALALMMSQQRAFQSTSGDRALQETARVALGHITGNLRSAGYGVDPALVFEFGDMNNVRMDRAFANATFSTTSQDAPCRTSPVSCRDHTDAPDELEFLSRDPAFGPHPLIVAADASSSSLKIAGPVRVALPPGQLLQVVCYTGAMTWAYVQVSGATTTDANGSVTIPIAASSSSDFPTQNASLGDPCFSTVGQLAGSPPAVTPSSLVAAARVFKIDRSHYFIQRYDATGATKDPWTAGARPYLMLGHGFTDADGNELADVVAPDVEDLQVAYVFSNAPANQLVGAEVGTAVAADATGIDLAPGNPPPAFSDDPTSPTRQTHHPWNIRAVRVALVVRSPEPDRQSMGDPIPAAGNRAARTPNDGHRRLAVEATTTLRNMTMLAPYYPTYDPSGASALNVGGG